MTLMLRIGSFGDAVKLLQSSLNNWKKSITPNLAVDGAFGGKTDAKVREFQVDQRLSADGIVGPMTQSILDSFLSSQISNVLYGNEDFLMAQVVQRAETALVMYGWKGDIDKPETRFPHSTQIAAALQSGPPVGPGVRARQGGQTLRMIFDVAGAGPKGGHCTMLRNQFVYDWQLQASDDPAKAQAARERLNMSDVPSWCGIFAFFIYKCAGIDLHGWMNYVSKGVDRIDPPFETTQDISSVKPGWIGVLPKKGQHHFIVVDNSGSAVRSIDGNMMHDVHGTRHKGYRSTVARGKWDHATIKSSGGYFLRPVYSKIVDNATQMPGVFV